MISQDYYCFDRLKEGKLDFLFLGEEFYVPSYILVLSALIIQVS